MSKIRSANGEPEEPSSALSAAEQGRLAAEYLAFPPLTDAQAEALGTLIVDLRSQHWAAYAAQQGTEGTEATP